MSQNQIVNHLRAIESQPGILVKQSSFKAALPQPPPDIPDICNNSETWKPVEQFFDADIFEQKEQKSCGCGYRKAAVAPANHNRLCT